MTPSDAQADVVPLFPGGTPLAARADDELLLLVRAGHPEAFDVLVRRHQGPALKIAAKYLGQVAAARDACQNAFLEVYRGLPRYRPDGRFHLYLRRVVLNQCRMLGRSSRIAERATRSLAEEPAPAVRLADDLLIANERRREVERALSGLSDKLREVVALRYAGMHSLEEVADILELPVGTVKSRLFAAMEKLKERLE